MTTKNEPLFSGKNIAAAREMVNMTRSELARRSGVSRSHIYKLENDEFIPTIRIVEKLETALGINLIRNSAVMDISIQEQQIITAWRNGRLDIILRIIAKRIGVVS